jgi:hypothetical protein
MNTERIHPKLIAQNKSLLIVVLGLLKLILVSERMYFVKQT